MYASRWANAWMMTGLLWFTLAIAWAPSNKLYQQGLVVLIWLPAALLAWSGRQRLAETWRMRRIECLALVGLAGWALLSLIWSTAEDPVREAKRILFVALFLTFFVLLSDGRPARLLLPLRMAGVGLALAAWLAIWLFYGRADMPWQERLSGIGQLDHPILGAYVMGSAAIWLLSWRPHSRGLVALWLFCLCGLAAFLALTQSRGAGLAFLAALLAMPLWRRDRLTLVFSGVAMALGGLLFWLFQPLVLERGLSYRPDIFLASLEMIASHPWTGLGLGSPYDVLLADGALRFDHAHNMPLHLAIELGLPALLLWGMLWLGALRAAWRARYCEYGGTVLGLLIFAGVAVQLDAASLWDSPRPEWFVTWLPLVLAGVLPVTEAQRRAVLECPAQIS